MKATIIKNAVALFGASTTSVFAASSNLAGDGSGPLVWFLIGFGALIVMLQAIPALIMFVSMVKGLFSPAEKSATVNKG